jgi:hypothetical protein
MKKIIRLTETHLTRIVNRVLSEQEGNIRRYLDSQTEIQDINTVRDFFNYNGIEPLALDIWYYVVKEYKQYPMVITVNSMKYNAPYGDDVLVLFKKDGISLEKERKTLNSRSDWNSRGHFSHSTMGKGPFSWSLLKQMMNEPS